MENYIDQLMQLATGPIWDGNLISKNNRDDLVSCGYAMRTRGYTLLTKHGLNVLLNIHLIGDQGRK